MLAPWVIEHMPAHRIYVEPYGGGASVLLRKARSWCEVYNDLDGEIVNVFRVVRDHGPELRRLLDATPFARQEFDDAHKPARDPVEQARDTIIRSFMGYGADSVTRTRKSGFRANSNHENQGRTAARDWRNYAPAIDQIRERLMGVTIENRDALQVMSAQDSVDTLHFVDPPYLFETRQDKRHGYRFEMTNEDHERLIDFLQTKIKGMVMLCGYDNALYCARLDWMRITRSAYADGGSKRTEVLWMNNACVNAQAQQRLL